jgi:hypothetical protein
MVNQSTSESKSPWDRRRTSVPSCGHIRRRVSPAGNEIAKPPDVNAMARLPWSLWSLRASTVDPCAPSLEPSLDRCDAGPGMSIPFQNILFLSHGRVTSFASRHNAPRIIPLQRQRSLVGLSRPRPCRVCRSTFDLANSVESLLPGRNLHLEMQLNATHC